MEQVLEAWGPVRRVRSLGGGNRNEVLQLEMLLAGRDGFSSAGPGSMSP